MKALITFVEDMNTKINFPTICPACKGELAVISLHCTDCDTTISGSYPVPAFLRLKAEEQRFILDFVKCSGSLKEMSQQMGLSYPTVRNILDEIIDNLKTLEQHG